MATGANDGLLALSKRHISASGSEIFEKNVCFQVVCGTGGGAWYFSVLLGVEIGIVVRLLRWVWCCVDCFI